MKKYWMEKVIAGARHMRLLALLLCCLLTTAHSQSVPPRIPPVTLFQARIHLAAFFPEIAAFNDLLTGAPLLFGKTRTLDIAVTAGTLHFNLLSITPQGTDRIITYRIVLNNLVTLADTSQFRFRPGVINAPVQLSDLTTGDNTAMLLIGFRSVGVSDSVFASFSFLPNDYLDHLCGTEGSVMDSVRVSLALLRWGIKAISYTDSVFSVYHQRETGMFATRYFAASLTDAQVDSVQRSGALIYYMGTKSGGKTPIRGYGR